MSVAARRSAAGKIGEAPSWAAIARMGYRPGDGPARRPVGPATRGDTIGLACATRRRERGHSARAARGDPARRPRRAPGEAGRSAALRQRERLVPVGARPRESGTRKGHPPPSRLTSSAARRRQAGPAARERQPVARAPTRCADPSMPPRGIRSRYKPGRNRRLAPMAGASRLVEQPGEGPAGRYATRSKRSNADRASGMPEPRLASSARIPDGRRVHARRLGRERSGEDHDVHFPTAAGPADERPVRPREAVRRAALHRPKRRRRDGGLGRLAEPGRSRLRRQARRQVPWTITIRRP